VTRVRWSNEDREREQPPATQAPHSARLDSQETRPISWDRGGAGSGSGRALPDWLASYLMQVRLQAKLPILDLGLGPVRTWFRYAVSLLALVLGAGTLSPLIQANWQEWAKATSNNQYFLKYGAAIVANASEIVESSWFVFAVTFFVGGAICLWIDRLLRGAVTVTQSNIPESPSPTASELAHGLHLVGGNGMNVIVDQRRKMIQIGFRLKNSFGRPLKYQVNDMTAIVEGKSAVMNLGPLKTTGTVARDDIITYFYTPIAHAVGKEGARAEASIAYQYGLSDVGDPMLREATYRVKLTISPKTHQYRIMMEKDAQV
jgi:hypothetical protein